MIYTAVVALALLQESLADLPEAVQKTVVKELGEDARLKKVKKEKDGTFSVETKSVKLELSESGELIRKEEDVAADALPEKVREAARKEFGEAEFQAVKLTERGNVVFEVESGDVTLFLAEDGALAAKEQKLKAEDLPAAVADAVKAKFPDASIRKVKKVTREAKSVFEVSIKRPDKTKAKATFAEDGAEIQP